MLSILGATYDDMEQVLKGLGYRAQKRLESEIIVPLDTTADEKEAEATTKIDSENDEALTQETEPKTLLLWQRDFKSKQKSTQKDPQEKHGKSARSKPPSNTRNAGAKRQEKAPDPNSPFAKLAALRASMKER